jgi:hypothetical protein
MWLHIESLCEQYELTGDNYIVRKDIGGVFWEPLWDRIFKFGLMLKHVPKSIKYIKGEWMRPLLYLESQSNDIVTFDGVQYKINKTANSAAVNLRVALRNLLNSLTNASKITNESFNNDYKQLKEDDKYFFKMLNAYVKEGYRPMHENVKDILLPLRLLRKGGYRLFAYEERINKNIDLNLFKNKEHMTIFVNSIKEEFKADEILQAKNNTPEELEQIMQRETQANNMKYVYNEEKMKEEKKEQNPYDSIALKSENNPKTAKKANELAKKKFEQQQKAIQDKEDQEKRKLIFPNLSNLTQTEIIKFERDALVADFEKGFKAMVVYLNNKFPLQIPELIDAHKLTANLENIPKSRYEANFYMSKLEKVLYDLKKMCYEMKLNGLTRILLPITANIEFTTQVKLVYDLHVSIDRLMGDKLKLEQYSFIFKEIDFISKSNFKDELFFFKDKNFMEIGVSKYIFYQALCNSVEVMEKMRKNNRINGIKYDNIDNYFQTTKLSLDSVTEYNSFNLYNFDNYIAEETKAYTPDLKKQIALDRITLNQELKQIGRFFMLENFMDPDQKDNWIDLTTQLIEINSSVREDIKEHLLRSSSIRVKEHVQNDSKATSRVSSRHASRRNSRSSSRKATNKHPAGYYQNMSKSIIPQKNQKKNQGVANNLSMSTKFTKSGKKDIRKKKEMSMDNVLEDSSTNLIIVKDLKISRFKPPFIWHFPIERIRELQKKNNTNNYEISTTNVDFNTIYKDGRVERFLELFNAVFDSCMKYCQEKLRNNWEYMLYKQFEIFDIKYQPFTDKFFRKIDLKPPEPQKEGEGEIVNEENKEENKEEEKNDEYKDEVIHTEIEGES